MPNIKILAISMKAEADLSTHQFKLVKLTGDRQVNLADGNAGEACLGVLLNKPDANEYAEVAVMGQSQVEAGNTITAGQLLRSNGSGVAQPVAADKDRAFGVALAGASSGEQCPVLLIPGGESGDYS